MNCHNNLKKNIVSKCFYPHNYINIHTVCMMIVGCEFMKFLIFQLFFLGLFVEIKNDDDDYVANQQIFSTTNIQ